MSLLQPVYLNHAGTSWPKPQVVIQAATQAMATPLHELDDSFERQHQCIADFFKVRDKTRLLLTPGCTSSIALALADFSFQNGNTIVTSSFEHHAVHRSLLKLVQQGFNLEVIPPTVESPFDLERYGDVLQKGGVSLVAVCSASNVTGQVLPLQEITQLAHGHGAKVLVDAAQTVGWFEHNLPESGVDLFAFGGHKGLLAPWGIGGLFVADETPMDTPQATCQLSASSNDAPALRQCSTMPSYCDGGSVDRMALAGMEAALAWLPQQTNRIEQAISRYNRLFEAVSSLPGVIIYGHPVPDRQLPLISFNVSGLTTKELNHQLNALHLKAAAGLQCAPLAHQMLGTEPEGAIRLSIGVMSQDNEIDLAVERLNELAKILGR